MLNWVRQKYGDIEIFITENGVSDNGTFLNDDFRIDFYEVSIFTGCNWTLTF